METFLFSDYCSSEHPFSFRLREHYEIRERGSTRKVSPISFLCNPKTTPPDFGVESTPNSSSSSFCPCIQSAIFQHYMLMCQQMGLTPTTPPAFGKFVRKAFPAVKCNRKGPRGNAKVNALLHSQRLTPVFLTLLF